MPRAVWVLCESLTPTRLVTCEEDMIWVLIHLMDIAFFACFIILFARVVLPLVGADPYNPIVQFIYRITEPLLAPLRRWTIAGNLDFSPMAVMVILMIARELIMRVLYALL